MTIDRLPSDMIIEMSGDNEDSGMDFSPTPMDEEFTPRLIDPDVVIETHTQEEVALNKLREEPPDDETILKGLDLEKNGHIYCNDENCKHRTVDANGIKLPHHFYCSDEDCGIHHQPTESKPATKECLQCESGKQKRPTLEEVLTWKFKDVMAYVNALPVHGPIVYKDQILERNDEFEPPIFYQPKPLYGDPMVDNPRDGPYSCPMCNTWFTKEDLESKDHIP